jgi:diguanylate cyclase (GGDEF)-like protein
MRVVVVDPSRTVLKLVSGILEAREYDVCTFADGPAALAHIKSDLTVEVLITSSELTSMSGVELCWETRLISGGRRPIYILLMSSNQDRSNLIEALDCGADDFIGQPPIPEELYARLRAAARLASMQNDLIRLATTDPLTGVLNRRAFFERAEEVIAWTKAGGRLAAIMFDIDHFKQINDTCGHAVGDDAIRGVAQEAEKEGAILGRLGGEEFAILLRGQGLAAAAATAEGLRQRMAALSFATDAGPMSLTCSFGVSEWEGGDAIDLLLRRADIALYAAKGRGRNRVVVADAALAVPGYDTAGRAVRGSARGEPTKNTAASNEAAQQAPSLPAVG